MDQMAHFWRLTIFGGFLRNLLAVRCSPSKWPFLVITKMGHFGGHFPGAENRHFWVILNKMDKKCRRQSPFWCVSPVWGVRLRSQVFCEFGVNSAPKIRQGFSGFALKTTSLKAQFGVLAKFGRESAKLGSTPWANLWILLILRLANLTSRHATLPSISNFYVHENYLVVCRVFRDFPRFRDFHPFRIPFLFF